MNIVFKLELVHIGYLKYITIICYMWYEKIPARTFLDYVP